MRGIQLIIVSLIIGWLGLFMYAAPGMTQDIVAPEEGTSTQYDRVDRSAEPYHTFEVMYQSTPYTCYPTCVSMSLWDLYRVNYTEQDIISEVGDSPSGYTDSDMECFLSNHGFTLTMILPDYAERGDIIFLSGTYEDPYEYECNGSSYVGWDDTSPHCVVFITSDGGGVWLADPLSGYIWMDRYEYIDHCIGGVRIE